MTDNKDTFPGRLDIAINPSSYPMKVYYDDGELYVSSDEVRIRDRSWKLEDIEYVNLECFEGWVWRVIVLIIQASVICLIFTNTNIINRNMFLFFFWGLCYFAMQLIGHLLVDDLTGFYNLRVVTRDSANQTFGFRGKGKFLHPGAISKYTYILQTFTTCINVALEDMFELQKYDINDRKRPTNKRYFFVDNNEVRLYGMTWKLDSIRKIACYEEARYKKYAVTFANISLVFLAPVILLLLVYFDTHTSRIIIAYLWALNILFLSPLTIPKLFSINILFTDGARKTITKWPDDPAKDALNEFADAVRKQIKLSRKAKRAEQHG